MVQQVAPHDSPTVLDLCKRWSVQDSFDEFRDYMVQSLLLPRGILLTWSICKAIDRFSASGLYAEFGVFKGQTINMLSRNLVKQNLKTPIWGFDSFLGLEEDWIGAEKPSLAGKFSTQGVLPEVSDNVRLVVGAVQDTVGSWLETQSGPIAFAHLDLDTYTPSRHVLQVIKPRLVKGSIIVLDELYGYPGWRQNEYKALNEEIPSTSFKYIAFSSQSAAIEII